MDQKTVARVASIAGLVLSGAGALISAWAGEKQKQEAIAKEVAKALAKQKR